MGVGPKIDIVKNLFGVRMYTCMYASKKYG